jgi:UDP-N-acetylmuramoylalanine--D-glutamate ligase
MRTVVIGGGLSGKAAARLAAALGDEAVIVADGPGVDPAAALAGAGLIVVSPGVKPTSPLYRAALASGVEFISELEFGFRHFPNRFPAVTGTNGKTTTVELTVHLLRAAGRSAVGAGNIGLPLADVAADLLAGKLPLDTLPVVEVSSFQLERCFDFAPLAAVILNVESDHLDRYAGGMAEYRKVKAKIMRCVPPRNRIFGRSMNEPSAWRRVTDDGDEIRIDDRPFVRFSETNLRGGHNLENLVAALELCRRMLPEDEIFAPAFLDAVRKFHAGAHRLELVCVRDGVRYVNDSKATNPAAVTAALRALSKESTGFHLLLGGLDKAMNFSELKSFSGVIRCGYFFGQCRKKIIAELDGVIPCREFDTDFAAAVKAAMAAARPGETVLLAPGCASMDMFRDYIHRGEVFRELVKNPS